MSKPNIDYSRQTQEEAAVTDAMPIDTIQDGSSIELRAHHDIISMIVLDREDKPFCAVSFKADEWIVLCNKIIERAKGLLS